MSKSMSSVERQKRFAANREAEGKFKFQKWVPVAHVAKLEWFIEFLDSGEFTINWLKERMGR